MTCVLLARVLFTCALRVCLHRIGRSLRVLSSHACSPCELASCARIACVLASHVLLPRALVACVRLVCARIIARSPRALVACVLLAACSRRMRAPRECSHRMVRSLRVRLSHVCSLHVLASCACAPRVCSHRMCARCVPRARGTAECRCRRTVHGGPAVTVASPPAPSSSAVAAAPSTAVPPSDGRIAAWRVLAL